MLPRRRCARGVLRDRARTTSIKECTTVDPVVTPSGHIYSKEAIYEYLLVKKEELNKARKCRKMTLLPQSRNYLNPCD
eukprot:418155-Amorphochlora_amoeboformis.AAC.1